MKIKKYISLILAILILVPNTGLALSVHYCGNNIASIGLKSSFSNQNKSSKNCCGVVINKNNCCNEKLVKIKKKSGETVVKHFSFSLKSAIIFSDYNIHQHIIFENNFKTSHTISFYCDANAPPFYKLYSQYIFYA